MVHCQIVVRDVERYVCLDDCYDSHCCQCSLFFLLFVVYCCGLLIPLDAFGIWQWLWSSVKAPQNLPPAAQRSWLLKIQALTVKLRLLRRCGMWHGEHCVVKAEV